MLSDLLYSLKETEFFFNLFGYISLSGIIMSGLFAFLVLFLMRVWFSFQLSIFASGEPIRNDGAVTHYHKKGTPTLGGVLILFSIILSSILWTSNFSSFNYILILTLTLFGLIGLVDDFHKVKLGKGISSKTKFLSQLLATLIIYFTIKYNGFDLNKFSIPFLKDVSIELGYIYFVLILLIVVGSTNATNLTDGLDGLVSMPLIFVFLTFAIFAYVLGNINFSDYLLAVSYTHLDAADDA